MSAILETAMPWIVGAYGTVLTICVVVIVKSQIDWRRALYSIEHMDARSTTIRAFRVAVLASVVLAILIALNSFG